MSLGVMEGLVDAPKPQQLVFGDGHPKCLELYVVWCRRWAIEKADARLPIACVLDRIVPFSTLAGTDFVFVDAGEALATDMAHFAAYQGHRWFTTELAHWLLETGVCSAAGPRTQAHFIAAFAASSHADPDKVRAMYFDMEGAMCDALAGVTVDGFSLEGADQRRIDHEDGKKAQLYKKIFLAMQGSWLTRHAYSWD